MALAEGLRRIRRIGKGILWIGLAFIAIAVGLGLMRVPISEVSPAPIFMIFGVIGIYLWTLGVIILLVVWITEGFLLPRVPPDP